MIKQSSSQLKDIGCVLFSHYHRLHHWDCIHRNHHCRWQCLRYLWRKESWCLCKFRVSSFGWFGAWVYRRRWRRSIWEVRKSWHGRDTDGLKVAKFGTIKCPESIDLFLEFDDVMTPGPDGQVCVPTACKEADYVAYLSEKTPEGCTFSAGFSARSSTMLVTGTVLAGALVLLM